MSKKEKEQLEEVEQLPQGKETEESPSEEIEKPAELKIEETAETTVETEIEKTKEELDVIKEVREELVSVYSKQKDLETEKEQLKQHNDTLSKENKLLTAELLSFKQEAKEVAEQLRSERLERLNKKFKALGQEKSVEQLSEKTDETLEEFEKLVDAALNKVGEVEEAPTVTESSQGAEIDAPAAEPTPKASDEVKPQEKLSDEVFFAGICNKMTHEQEKTGKRVQRM